MGEVFDADAVLSRLRQVQAIVTLLERHPRSRAEAAAERALRTGDCSYRAIRHLLTLGLDLFGLLREHETCSRAHM